MNYWERKRANENWNEEKGRTDPRFLFLNSFEVECRWGLKRAGLTFKLSFASPQTCWVWLRCKSDNVDSIGVFSFRLASLSIPRVRVSNSTMCNSIKLSVPGKNLCGIDLTQPKDVPLPPLYGFTTASQSPQLPSAYACLVHCFSSAPEMGMKWDCSVEWRNAGILFNPTFLTRVVDALADDEHSPDRDVNSYLWIPSKSRILFVPSLDRLIERWSELSSVRLSHL